jgi:hypothetical protein
VSTDRIFLAFALVVGIAVGGVIVLVPQSRAIGLAPYFWVLIAFALFEGAIYARRGGARDGDMVNVFFAAAARQLGGELSCCGISSRPSGATRPRRVNAFARLISP